MSVQPGVNEKTQNKNRAGFFTGAGCWASLVIIGISLILYVIACATPAMVFDKETWLGIEVLIIGWQGLFLGQLAWFANAFWFVSLLLAFFRRWILTLTASFVTMLIALDALSFVGTKVPLDEAFVNTMLFRSYHVGFYFWIASLGIVGLGALVMWIISIRLSLSHRNAQTQQ
ncbi:MAG TPA: hypothetical protein VF478_11255 [Anaerolineae bacterium]